MGGSRKPGPECVSLLFWPFDTGTLCLQQSPIPGPVGIDKQPGTHDPRSIQDEMIAKMIAEDEPWSGSVPASLGLPSIVGIPIPGSRGLAIELIPRNYPGVSTSTLFFQDITGKRHLRLDYGPNVKTKRFEWHWNKKNSIADTFGSGWDHKPATSAERAVGRSAKYFKYGGRVLLVIAAVSDIYSIVTSSNPLRRTVQVVSAWAAMDGGCLAVGAGGAALGTAIAPGIGTAIGGFIGCMAGGFIGYKLGETTSGYLYDWAEDTVFTKLKPETKPPAEAKPDEDPLKSLPKDPKSQRYLEGQY